MSILKNLVFFEVYSIAYMSLVQPIEANETVVWDLAQQLCSWQAILLSGFTRQSLFS